MAEVYYKNNELSLSYLNLAKYYANINQKDKANNYIKMALENTQDKATINKIEDLELTMSN